MLGRQPSSILGHAGRVHQYWSDQGWWQDQTHDRAKLKVAATAASQWPAQEDEQKSNSDTASRRREVS